MKTAPEKVDWEVNEGEKPIWTAEGSLPWCVLNANGGQAYVQKEALVENC